MEQSLQTRASPWTRRPIADSRMRRRTLHPHSSGLLPWVHGAQDVPPSPEDASSRLAAILPSLPRIQIALIESLCLVLQFIEK